jgi:hypothetical protein
MTGAMFGVLAIICLKRKLSELERMAWQVYLNS